MSRKTRPSPHVPASLTVPTSRGDTLNFGAPVQRVTRQPPATLRIPFVRRCELKGALTGPAMLLDLSLQGVYIASEELPRVGKSR